MAVPIRMLRLSKGMEVGRVVTWLKAVGEPVGQGEAVVAIETEKSVVEVEAPANGVVLQVIVGEDEEVPVGTVLAWIGKPGESVPVGDLREASQREVSAAGEISTDGHCASAVDSRAQTDARKVRAAPAVRRLAAQHGIDLHNLDGSGAGGRVTRADVQAAIATGHRDRDATAQSDDAERVPLKWIRRIMALRMAHSAQTYAATTTVLDVDMGQIKRLKKSEAISYTSAVVKTAAMALREHRILNASLEGEQILLHNNVNVGVAVDSPRGLTVVTIAAADEKTLAQTDRVLRDLSAQAKQGSLKPQTLDPPTFTVTNSGAQGSLMFTPMINPPQSAVLGIGKIQDTPVIREGQIVARPVTHLCLTYDHRIIEGAEAVRFLQTVKGHLENPKEIR